MKGPFYVILIDHGEPGDLMRSILILQVLVPYQVELLPQSRSSLRPPGALASLHIEPLFGEVPEEHVLFDAERTCERLRGFDAVVRVHSEPI